MADPNLYEMGRIDAELRAALTMAREASSGHLAVLADADRESYEPCADAAFDHVTEAVSHLLRAQELVNTIATRPPERTAERETGP